MAVTWRVARSLDVLLGQLNALAPTRNKASDGSIGDTNHQNRSSDHNPWYGPGIVTARDFTHDPGKLSGETVATTLAAHRDPRIKYVIWNRRIMSGAGGPYPWMWRAYTGSNPHTSHLHLSVVANPLCDNQNAWSGFTTEESQMELTTPMRPYFSTPGTTWSEDVKKMDVGATLANMYSLLVAVSASTGRLETANGALRTEVAGLRTEVTELKNLITQLVSSGFKLGATGEIIVKATQAEG